MAKTILVPIDFRVESLNTLKFALVSQDKPVNVIFLYGHMLSDSISDLLFYSPKSIIASLTSLEFEQALEILKNRFSKNIVTLKTELLNAANLNLLKNILSHHEVKEIYLPKTYKLKPGKKGFDTSDLLKKTGLAHEIDWHMHAFTSEKDQLDSLFN